MSSKESHDIRKPKTRTFVLYPQVREHLERGIGPAARLEEAKNLALAINLDIIDAQIIKIRDIKPNTFLGSGTVEELKGLMQHYDIDLVVFDGTLSPVQQRNLEKAWNVKVIERTALIIEIFGDRARTAEGSLQVELAALSYQKSRLVRSWTHLERQRGGLGFIGGPGETQLEVDRRLISERITKIEKELEKVKNRRAIQRQSRARVPYPIVALVGYTNAGKSSLFNTLTNSDVFAKDLLFATLDPTMRLMTLPSGQKVILSDTVGFISDLPTTLIAAFRSTLEEVLEAEIILHIQDGSNPNCLSQSQDVYEVLSSLGIDKENHTILEVMNKVDLLTPEEKEDCPLRSDLETSAVTSVGIDKLRQMVDKIMLDKLTSYTLKIPISQGKLVNWLHKYGVIKSKTVTDTHWKIKVLMSPANNSRYLREVENLDKH